MTADLPDTLQFMQMLWAIAHRLDRRSKQMRADIGITGPQRLVLRVMGLSPGISAGELAAVLHVHPSTLTGVLQRLAAQGLVLRLAHPRDRRRAVLRLSVRGARINATSDSTVESAIAQALQDVSAGDRAATARVLARVACQLESAPRSERGRSGNRRRVHPLDHRRVSQALRVVPEVP